MSTATLQKSRSILVNKNKASRKRKIVRLFYSEACWKLSSRKELNEKEINEVIRRLTEFYSLFLKKREKELESFGFEVDFDRASSLFNLKVTLSSFEFIPTTSFDPPVIDLPLDQLSPDNIKVTHTALQKNGNAPKNGAPKNGPGSVDPTLHNLTFAAFDSTPTQDTGKTPPPIKTP
ncbi:MAG TPA: hypothetical protein VL832_26950 [Puia sp.]|nr:hypothetical protein [Puia sp.]